jgi:riboflavin biosynthesis pyrimidine reductase
MSASPEARASRSNDLRAGLLDEIQIHVAPLLLGGGVRLFEGTGGGQIELEPTRVIESPGVTHLRYRVVK